METGLINANEFHYSQKGKEMSHYRLANKYIVIAPKKTYGIKEKLKSILPVALIAAGAAGLIQLSSNYFLNGTLKVSNKPMAAEYGIAKKAMASAPPQNIALWFLAGALFTLGIYFVFSLARKD